MYGRDPRRERDADVIVESTKDAAYAHVLRVDARSDFRVVHLVRGQAGGGVPWSWAKVVQSDRRITCSRFPLRLTRCGWWANQHDGGIVGGWYPSGAAAL